VTNCFSHRHAPAPPAIAATLWAGAKEAFALLRSAKSIISPFDHNAARRGAVLTSKGKYGLKAIIHLAGLEAGATAQVAEIAQKNNISKKFLDAILLDLRNAGMLRSKKGPGGGYALAKPARTIMVGAVIRALEGPVAPIACASRSAYRPCEDCSDTEACSVRAVMGEVRDAIAEIVDNTTIADLVRRSQAAARGVSDYVI
jgi:Rrf2 family protein